MNRKTGEAPLPSAMPRSQAEQLYEQLDAQTHATGSELAALRESLKASLDARLPGGETSPDIILGTLQVAAIALYFQYCRTPEDSPYTPDYREAYGLKPLALPERLIIEE